MFRKNVAGQFIHVQGVDAATGGIKSGVTWTVRRCIDGTFAAAGGTATEDGTTGWYKYALAQADTNGNNIAFSFTGTGAVPMTINIVTTACDPTTATNFGITALPTTACTTNASLLTSGTGTAQLSVSSGLVTLAGVTHTGAVIPTVTTTTTATTTTNLTNLPSIPANWITAAGINAAALNGKGDWNVGKTGYTLTATTGLGNQTADITGNLSGSVGSVTAVSDKTGYALSATGSAALTESYAADGAAPTLNQILYQIWSMLSEKSITSTTLTAKKLDGSTTAMTFTLDSATAPTSITRAT